MAGVDSTKGYMLEEVLAYLIRNAGYRLLVDPEQDPYDLDWKGNGLVVIGRGTYHQVDVLGQLEWTPSFTFPIRLFAEAKFRSVTTGLTTVRNAVGTILDINQRYSSLLEQRDKTLGFRPKYQYAYALFSTSGFSKPATAMAMAHQISLVDLGGVEFEDLRNAISNAIPVSTHQVPREAVLGIRHALREELGTIPGGLSRESRYIRQGNNVNAERFNLREVVDTAYEYGEVFVGMANGPFMLLLKADRPQDFLRYAALRPSHDVTISWNPYVEEGRRWEIDPVERLDNVSYRLTFRLPNLLAKWIFASYDEARKRALYAKEQFLSAITIYTRRDREDHLFRLNFSASDTLRQINTGVGGWRT
jgi:hypothetical protein